MEVKKTQANSFQKIQSITPTTDAAIFSIAKKYQGANAPTDFFTRCRLTTDVVLLTFLWKKAFPTNLCTCNVTRERNETCSSLIFIRNRYALPTSKNFIIFHTLTHLSSNIRKHFQKKNRIGKANSYTNYYYDIMRIYIYLRAAWIYNIGRMGAKNDISTYFCFLKKCNLNSSHIFKQR